jgi:hypothetical protein
MTLTDTVVDLAENVTEFMSILASEVFVGLVVATGLVIWVLAGKRDGFNLHRGHDDTSPSARTSSHRF